MLVPEYLIMDYEFYYRAIVTNSTVIAQNMHEDQCARTEDLEINTQSSSHVVMGEMLRMLL